MIGAVIVFAVFMSPPVRAVRAVEMLTDQPYITRRARVQDAGTVREAGYPVYAGDGSNRINPLWGYVPFYIRGGRICPR